MELLFSRKGLCLLLAVISPSLTAFGQENRPANVQASPTPSEQLHQLFKQHWNYTMEEFPEFATYTGHPGQNHRWTDLSAEAIERRKQDLRGWLQTLEGIERAKLNAADQLNHDLFRKKLTLELEESRFPTELLPINQMSGVQQSMVRMTTIMPRNSERDYQDLLARMRSTPVLIEQTIALLRRGLAQGITPPRITLRDVPSQVRNQIVEDLLNNPVYGAFTNFPGSISAERQRSLTNAAGVAIREQLLPALRRLDRFLTTEYLPKARETVAASALPNGEEWYAFNARRYTTTELSPTEIHKIGLAEVARIRAEMERVIKEAEFKGSFDEFVHFLRTDPQFFYSRPEELIAGYREIAKRADPELPKLFGKLPRLPYGVLPIPSYAEKSQTTAYYQPGANAFGRAGYFYANTYALHTRPKWEMEALTLHEAMPGHHLQIALAQEMENVPEFRKHGGYTAFVEGWGLYSESLGEEMGFYKDPYSKFGQLTYEMWRAVRLVVDTGIHALGWSREKAIEYFKSNAPKTEHDIVVEIDRYIVWPGQALAYKIGELKIKELRRKAEEQLGADFNIREFHDELLGEGAIPLDVLERRMEAWWTKRKTAKTVN